MNPLLESLIWAAIAIGIGERASGYSVSGTVYTTNGSQSDVQGAVTVAPKGSIIAIPAGTFSWSAPVTVHTDVSIRGAGVSNTTVACSGDNGLLVISNPTPFACTVSGITFNGANASGDNQTGILITTPALLHDCNFNSNGGYLDLIRFMVNGGVIWNWTFYDNDQNEEAITFKNPTGGANGISPSWTTNDTMGMADTNGTANTYVENCTFNEMKWQALDLDDNSRVVVRYCTFNNSGLTSHGLDTSPYGTRHWEIYNNTFIFPTSGLSLAGILFPLNLNWWFYCRGGTGVIFNNVMPDLNTELWGNKASILFTVFNIRRASAYIPVQSTWQAMHQVGQGYQNGLVLDPVYIWGNQGGTNYNSLNLTDYQPDQFGLGLTSSEFIQLNRDVYLGTAKPGYVPYTYPHPLRTGGSQPTQQPTPTPTPSATPAPTPTPGATPTPAGSLTYSTWQGQLNSYLQNQLGFSLEQVLAIDTSLQQNNWAIPTWIQANPPTPDPYTTASPTYWHWEGRLNWSLQNEEGFLQAQVSAIDTYLQQNWPLVTWIQANPPASNP